MCVSMSGFVQTHTQYHSKGKSTEGPVKAQMTLQDYQALSAMPLLMYLACFLLSVCLHLVSKELRFFLPSYSLEASHSAAISIADPQTKNPEIQSKGKENGGNQAGLLKHYLSDSITQYLDSNLSLQNKVRRLQLSLLQPSFCCQHSVHTFSRPSVTLECHTLLPALICSHCLEHCFSAYNSIHFQQNNTCAWQCT